MLMGHKKSNQIKSNKDTSACNKLQNIMFWSTQTFCKLTGDQDYIEGVSKLLYFSYFSTKHIGPSTPGFEAQ